MSLKIKLCASLLILINIKVSLAEDEKAPVVTLPKGKIQGHALQSPQGDTRYYAYQNIPYAAPPVGKLRFQEPVEPESWNVVLNTTHNTHSCFLNGEESQLPLDVTQDEDCLYLNVYTPVKPGTNSDPLPVLFWIHGGGFHYGDGTFQTYGPQFLIEYDIVIVTINYRLGAFGFLTTEDGVIPGNLGLKDQNLALRWVNANIALFGGDPSKITIDGESAGGSSVGYHILSKQSEGLFRGAILQSGTALCSFGFQTYAKYFAFQLGSALKPEFNSENSTELLDLLQSVSATDINDIHLQIPDDKVRRVLLREGLVWVPVIEDVNYETAFITRPMHEDFKTGNINKVPTLIGFNSEEGTAFVDSNGYVKNEAAVIDTDLSKLVNDKYNMDDKDKYIAGRMLRQLYTDKTFQLDFSAVVKFLTDEEFTTPIIRHAELQSKYTDVFLYEFAYKGAMGCANLTIEGADNVGHAEDLKYLWHIDRLDDGSIFSAADRLTQRRLLKLWSNFVKNLNPTPEKDPLFENILWPKVSPDNISYLNINRTLEVRRDPRQYQKFEAIVDRYAKPPLTTY